MNYSNKLAAEREAEIAAFEDTYDDPDLPSMTREQMERMRSNKSELSVSFTVQLSPETVRTIYAHARASGQTPAEIINEWATERPVAV